MKNLREFFLKLNEAIVPDEGKSHAFTFRNERVELVVFVNNMWYSFIIDDDDTFDDLIDFVENNLDK